MIRAMRVFAALMVLFLNLPISIAMSYLLYKHVDASPVMWLLWWAWLPLTILTSTIGTIVDKILQTEEKKGGE